MVLGEHARSAPPRGVEVRLARLEDDFTLLGAVAPLAFGAPGTAVGVPGVEAVHALAARGDPARVALNRERLRQGFMVTAVAFVDGEPVGIGFHQPVKGVTELVGIGVVPAFRRRGIGAALTDLLVADAVERGVATVFLSAGSAAIVRVYGRIGFERVGTACVAEPPGDQPP
jgi:ribosomal protein S18 acetylase RimI-like enzyme